MPQAMHLLAEPLVVVRLWLYEAVKRAHHMALEAQHSADTAHAGWTLVRRLKVYGNEILYIAKIQKNE